MKKILFVLPFNPSTGVNGRKKDAIETLIRAHEYMGYNSIFVTTDYDFDFDSEVTRYSSSFLRLVLDKMLGTKNLLIKKIAKRTLLYIKKKSVVNYSSKNKIDLIFSCSLNSEANLLAYSISKEIGVDYVVNEHRTTFQRLIENKQNLSNRHKKCLEGAKCIFPLTQAHQDAIKCFTSSKCFVLPLVMTEDYLTSKVLDKPAFSIASWTNWRDIKRLDFLVEVFSLISLRIPNVVLNIAGPTPNIITNERAYKIIDKHGLSSRINFLGSLNRSQIRELALNSAVCAIPSDHETFGLPVAESLCSGTPVVTTKCGGPESFIEDGRNGYKIDKGDISNFTEKLFFALTKELELSRSVIACEARTVFSDKNMRSILQKTYSEILNK